MKNYSNHFENYKKNDEKCKIEIRCLTSFPLLTRSRKCGKRDLETNEKYCWMFVVGVNNREG